MADVVGIPDDLRMRFTQIEQIASIATSLQARIEQINAANVAAGGQHDKVADSYHGQIDGPTADLSTLTSDIASLFGVTAENGATAAGVINDGDSTAADHAETWNPGQ